MLVVYGRESNTDIGVTAFEGEKFHQFSFSCELDLISEETTEKYSFILNR